MNKAGYKTPLDKLQHYCAYQERCHQDVRNKLIELEVYGEELEFIISELIRENFLNEERFAQTYARSKFKFNHWGRLKIERQLKAKHVSSYCIRKGLHEIDEIAYYDCMDKLVTKKLQSLRGNAYEKRKKVITYMLQKGYEYALVLPIINDHVNL